MNPTGHMHFLAWLCLIAACWCGAALAAQTPAFTAAASGANDSLSITANLSPADADIGKNGNVYLVANVNGTWHARSGASWVEWRGGPIPVYSVESLAQRSVEVLRDFNAAAFVGTQIYLGYGRDEADMLVNGKYGLIYQCAAPVAVAQSSLPRIAAPAVSAADKTTLSADNADFALKLYRQLINDPAQGGENLFFSPLSISVALAMTSAGARGVTATEMASALRFTLPQERLHPAFGWLDLEMASRGQGALGVDGKPFRLKVSNSLWGDTQAQFETPFLDTLAQYYGAAMNLVDFATSPEPSRTRINDWVAEKTEQRIQNLLPQGSVSAATRLVLVNAVYFNAGWQSKFYPSLTTRAPFTRLDGSTAEVDMMNQDVNLRYAAGSDYQAVELPYDGNELGMLLILPTAGAYAQFEQALDSTKFAAIQASLGNQYSYVRLGLPKFKIEGGFSLKAAMQGLGMRAAFTDSADFSGISTSAALLIQDVFHKGFAAIDENGTEAAAATGAVGGVTSVPPTPTITFKADRPFIFAIVDKQTNTVVFLGRIVLPASAAA